MKSLMDAAENDLLGGALRTRTRVRGFASWSPRPDAVALLDQVRDVLTEYAEYLPLTLRQVFYRLVGAHHYEKTDRAYARLSETLNRGRRAKLIDMSAIRDGGGTRIDASAWRDAEDFLSAVRSTASTLNLDRNEGQELRLILMCEAAGMVPQLAAVAIDFGVPVISSGGFDFVTEKHDLAAEIGRDRRPTEILHIGDHDPSGAHLFLALKEDVLAFAKPYGGTVEFTRLAVTPDQITELRLETAPKKTTDGRAFRGETCQVEAIAPDVLAQIVRDAIESRIDQTVFRRLLAREKRVRKELAAKLK